MAELQPPATAGDRLLADIGGTNARFAWQRGTGAPIEAALSLPCADFATLGDALQGYLASTGRAVPASCAIAIATPVVGDLVQMTNHHWRFSIAGLRAQFGFAQLHVLNDFTALALALPLLHAAELRQVGGEEAVAGAAIGLIGPGTGLGVSGLLPDGRGGWCAVNGEGGHVSLAATTPREHAVLGQLALRHGHVSAERAVCGRGIVNLHDAIWRLDHGQAPMTEMTAAEVTAAAIDGSDATCVEALQLFCAFLGVAAGNLALTLGARGGVYIGGGIVPRLGDAFTRSTFRARFEGKGRFTDYLASIPVWVIDTLHSPALRGAASALDRDAR